MLIGSLVLASHGRLLRMLLAQQLGRPGQARPRLGVPVGRKSGTHFQLPKSGLGLHLDARDMSAAFLSARSSGLSGFRTAMRDRAVMKRVVQTGRELCTKCTGWCHLNP